MIIKGETEKLDGHWRLVMYDTDVDGKCVPRYTVTEFNEEIDSYYEQQDVKVKHLKKQLLASQISPLKFFMELYRLDAKGVASRAKLRPSVVKKHSTMEGFKNATVDMLQRYARIFNIQVADFFQFTLLKGDLEADVQSFENRMIQELVISGTEK